MKEKDERHALVAPATKSRGTSEGGEVSLK